MFNGLNNVSCHGTCLRMCGGPADHAFLSCDLGTVAKYEAHLEGDPLLRDRSGGEEHHLHFLLIRSAPGNQSLEIGMKDLEKFRW